MPEFREQRNFVRLCSRLREEGLGAVIPFVGAGLSIYGDTRQRMPSWRQLLELLRDAAASLGVLNQAEVSATAAMLDAGLYPAAADTIVSRLPPAEFRRIMHEVFGGSRMIPPAVEALTRLRWKLLITTNYDQLIERAWPHGQIPVLTGKDLNDVVYLVGGHHSNSYLLKLHGTLDRYDTWVLTDAQYDGLIVNSSAYEHVMKVLLSRSLLFIGFDMSDRDFNPFLRDLCSKYASGVGDHFAVLDERTRPQGHIQEVLRLGVQPIWYRSDPSRRDEPDCGHGTVLEILRAILSELAPATEVSVQTDRSMPYLMQPLPNVSLADFEMDAIQVVVSRFPEFTGTGTTFDPAHFLQHMGLLTVGDPPLPCRAAVLCFHRDPQRDMPQAMVVGSVSDTSGRTIQSVQIGGTLFDQLQGSLDFVLRNLRLEVRVTGRARAEVFEIPSVALRELLANALVHRSYEREVPVSVRITPDAVSIENPGEFAMPGWQGHLHDIWQIAVHAPRNPILARLLLHAGFVEAAGSGLLSVARALADGGLLPPEIQSTQEMTRVTLKRNRSRSADSRNALTTASRRRLGRRA